MTPMRPPRPNKLTSPQAVSAYKATQGKKALSRSRNFVEGEPLPGRNGVVITNERYAGGNLKARVISVTRTTGQTVGSPAHQMAYRIRSAMRPIRVAPARIFDAQGQLVATIETDPVTGKRTRRPM